MFVRQKTFLISLTPDDYRLDTTITIGYICMSHMLCASSSTSNTKAHYVEPPQWVNQEQECVRTNQLPSRWLFIVCHNPHHWAGLLITIANQQRRTQSKEGKHKKLFICLLKNKQHDKLIYSEWRWPIKETQRHSDSVTRWQRLDREPFRFRA